LKVIIAGGNGQLGSEFKKILNSEGFDFICLDRSSLDVTDFNQVTRVFCVYNPDIVINAAAYTAVDKAENNQAQANLVNCVGPKNLAEVSQIFGSSLIHISTDYVFSGDGEIPYVETDDTGPKGVYGKTKLAGENAVRIHLDQHIILRTAWVFGEFGNNFVKTMLRLASEKETLDIVGDQWGSPTSAKGIALCCLRICEKIRDNKNSISWGTYHYSGFPYINWYGFADVIFSEALGIGIIKTAPKLNMIDSDAFPAVAKRPVNSRLNCKKLCTQFEIQPDDWIKQLSLVLKRLK